MKHEEVVQMSFFSNIVKKYKRATPKQLMLAGVFMLAFAGAIGAGFASQQNTSAQEIRDCSYNSIDHNRVAGGCGALTPNELCLDMWTNVPGDLKSIYNEFGFQSNDCDTERVQKEARHGVINKNGDVIVDGEVVMTNAWTMGRTTLGGSQRTPYVINGVTYYHSHPSVSFGQNQLDVIVLFDNDGTVEFAVMEACGNPVTTGNKVRSGAKCEDLNKHATGKKNTYQFSTDAEKWGLAKYVKFNYYYMDGNDWKLFDTKSNPSDKTKEITFKKATKVKVEIEISLPGGKHKTITSTLCEKEIGVVKEEFLYACDALYVASKDNMTFRFTVQAKHSNNVKVVSADFTLDGNVTTKGVTDEDNDGNIYKEYTFNDEKSHTVSAVINFEYTEDDVVKKVQSKELCKKTVTPKKPPVCEYNPNLPPNHPDCKPPETCEDNPGKEGCELPKTGPAGVAGLFAGVTAAGAVGHRLFMNFRRRND